MAKRGGLLPRAPAWVGGLGGVTVDSVGEREVMEIRASALLKFTAELGGGSDLSFLFVEIRIVPCPSTIRRSQT
jgi:hypothetical protein